MTNINFINLEVVPLTVESLIILLCVSLLLGIVLTVVFKITHVKAIYEKTLPTTLLLLPVIVSVIILLISDNIARAFSLGGIFALVRFRMALNDSKDITYILTTVAIGLACALGYIGYAAIICAFICIIMLVLHFLNLEKPRKETLRLKILIPENLNYQDVFKDVFEKYLSNHTLVRVKSSDFGTIFELTYIIIFREKDTQKEFIDEVRIRNSNLTINLYNDHLQSISEF